MKNNIEDLDESECIFHNSLHDYYQLRPEDEEYNETGKVSNYWKNLCLADFVSLYNIDYTKNEKNIKLLDNRNFISKRRRPAVIRYLSLIHI